MRGARTALLLCVGALGMVFPGVASAEQVFRQGQVEKALAGGATYKYATIFIGTNDTCSDQTPAPTFREQIDSALNKLAPATDKIFVASIPDFKKLFDLYNTHPDPALRQQALTAWDTVNCRRFLTTDEGKKVGGREHLMALNIELQQACLAKGSKCVFDGGAVFNWPVQHGYFTPDFFHYSFDGQQALASVTFGAAGFSQPPPVLASMVALGDSFTAGLKSCPAPGTGGCQQNSWATGTDVNSHANRLTIPAAGRRNVSNGGDRAIDLTDHFVEVPAPQPPPPPPPAADGGSPGGSTPGGGAGAGGANPGGNDPGARRKPAKLKVKRASIRGGKLDALLSISGRATGDLEIRYVASGRRSTFKVDVGPARAAEKHVRVQRALVGNQRRVRTGIMSAIYRGNGNVLPESLRSRAANGLSRLKLTQLTFGESQLRVRGTINSKVDGVVRLRVIYTQDDGTVGYWRSQPRIGSGGRWTVDESLPKAVAADPEAYLTTQFTGDRSASGGPYRGEQDGKGLANLPAG